MATIDQGDRRTRRRRQAAARARSPSRSRNPTSPEQPDIEQPKTDAGRRMTVQLLAAMLCALIVGMLFGAAIQRWGDADRATHGHKEGY